MTAEERAEALLAAQEHRSIDFHMGRRGPSTYDERLAVLASAIRAAEDDVLVRAAKVLDATGAQLKDKAAQLRPLLATVADGVRSLKSSAPRRGRP